MDIDGRGAKHTSGEVYSSDVLHIGVSVSIPLRIQTWKLQVRDPGATTVPPHL